MMFVALILFVAVIAACIVAPSEGTKSAKAHAAPAAKQPALHAGEVAA